MRKKIYTLSLASIFLLSGCSTTNTSPASISIDDKSSNNEKISFGMYDIAKSVSISDLVTRQRQSASAENLAEVSTTKTDSVENNVATAASRMIVKNGSVLLESSNPAETLQKVANIAETKGGYVLNSEQSTTDVSAEPLNSIEISIRIASDQFEETLQEIRSSASRVLAENVKGEDVTEEFLDLAARIRTQKALEQQYLDILKQATTINDILAVQNQLSTVRTELEKLVGRTKYLRDRTAFSTITVSIKTSEAISFNSAGFFSRLGSSVSRGFEAASGITLGIVTILIGSIPFVIFIGLPIFLIRRYLWPRNSNKTSLSEIAKEEIKSE